MPAPLSPKLLGENVLLAHLRTGERCDSSEGFSGLGCSRQNSSRDWKHVAHIWIYLRRQAGHFGDSQARGSRANPSEKVPVVHPRRSGAVLVSVSSRHFSAFGASPPFVGATVKVWNGAFPRFHPVKSKSRDGPDRMEASGTKSEPAQRLSALSVNEPPVRVTVACLLL